MFRFGVDYYPEHWPETRWPEDARLMAAAGINVVRLAEFAWSKMEPSDGVFDFAWLDRAIDLLAAHGIAVILGTPTASPPPWLMGAHPDAYRVGPDGRRWTYGNRREYCPTHAAYRAHSRRITEAMAQHYATNPAVIGWQTDNEFGDRCYCPTCVDNFQGWLRGHYEDLTELNERWGTVFWSHIYNGWEEIPPPLATGGSPNPGLALAFYRFASDSYVTFQQEQIDILRAQCPNHFITHNFMGFGYDRINYFDLARNLDFVSWDNYQRMQWTMSTGVIDPAAGALAADTMRGLKQKNFWIMEQQAGSGGWEMVSVAPRPGEIRLWAYQSIAHGADAIVFFRWRTMRYGTEQYWHGILDHHGIPGRRYDEVRRMGDEITRAGNDIFGSTVRAKVAIVLSYDARFAFQIQPNNPQFDYPRHIGQIYRALHAQNIPVDIVAPTDDLSGYALVIAPSVYVLPDDVAANLVEYVRDGGLLVVTQRSGVKDDDNTVVNMKLPGLLAEVCGIEVAEYDSLAPDMSNAVEFVLPGMTRETMAAVGTWCDVLELAGAEAVALYTQDYYAGTPAITRNHFGAGQAIYIGTVGGDPFYATLTQWLLELAALEPLMETPAPVEVTERWQGDRRLLFVLNHSDSEQSVNPGGAFVDLLTNETIDDTVTLAPRGVLVLAAA